MNLRWLLEYFIGLRADFEDSPIPVQGEIFDFGFVHLVYCATHTIEIII